MFLNSGRNCRKRHDLSLNDLFCEEHFKRTHVRNDDGTYTVELSIRIDPSALDKSRDLALKRFLRLEERLRRNPDTKVEHVKAINEFLELGYMEPIPAEEKYGPPPDSHYIPHRKVVKESSLSTKVPVFNDASTPTSSGVSLNDTLHLGPKL